MSEQNPQVNELREQLSEAVSAFQNSLNSIFETLVTTNLAPATTQPNQPEPAMSLGDNEEDFIQNHNLAVTDENGDPRPLETEELQDTLGFVPHYTYSEDEEGEEVVTTHNRAITEEEFLEHAAEVRVAVEDSYQEAAETGETLQDEPIDFYVTYTKVVDEEELPLTGEEVETVLSSPISVQGLSMFGEWEVGRVIENEKSTQVEIVLVDTGEIPVEAIHLGFVGYKGVTVIPGVGVVQAVGGTRS